MELSTAIKLIEPGLDQTRPSTWADLGAGTGLFTNVLATLLAKGSSIYAVDSNASALMKIKSIDGINLHKLVADIEHTPSARPNEGSRDLQLTDLDGILMANSLHFVKDKAAFIQNAGKWLNSTGVFIIVEYDFDKPNRWVPYPISFANAEKLFGSLGYRVELMARERSMYNKEGIYSMKIQPSR